MSTAQPKIRVLPEHVKNQIAAGEVIERPASVVKELVENALDAGATNVTIDLEEGGVRLVRVVDDGDGMTRSDLELAFVPHATSKLGDASDLDHIASLGFRGEALASMGAVARCRIVSRPREADTGFAMENDGGTIRGPVEAGGPRGTTIEVRDLFFNVPARRRFLKTTPTELGRCLDVVHRLALAHMGVGFVMTHDGRRLFDVEASMDLAARVRRTFGAELAESLVEVQAREGDLELTGFVAPPRFARGDTARQMWFANGRPLKDRVLVRCLKEAYRGALFEGRQPVAFLNLALDPKKIDVNVHPAKAEVRFHEQQKVFGFCLTALRSAVRQTDMATPGGALVQRAARRTEHPGQRGFRDAPRAALPAQRDSAEPFVVRELPGPLPEIGQRPAPASPPAGEARAVGEAGGTSWQAKDPLRGPFLRIARTYIAFEVDDGFELVDQHALHERVTYEDLLADARAGRIETQRLLVPELIELPRPDVALVEEHAEAVRKAGIELSPFGEGTVALSAVPVRLERSDPEELVHGVVDVVRRAGKAPDAEALLGEVLHSAACRGSVMAGDHLSDEEIRSLLERAAALEHDQTCPHGRPTRVRFSQADLETAFLRK